MPSIGDALPDCLRSIERTGDFCVGGLREVIMPAVDVDGVGRLAFPLLPVQIAPLVAVAEAAPYGRGAETVVDREVRRTWQIGPDRIRIGGRRWAETLDRLVAEAAQGLGIGDPVAADFYKLLVYDAGSFFVGHRDTEKRPGMFATLVVVLPSAHSGGELAVRHLGREVVLDLRPDEPSEIGFAAFYADCVHEIRPVIAGCRVALVYNLRFLGRKQPPKPPDYRTEQGRIGKLLRRWAAATDEPDKLILPLDHAYTPAELSFATLKGRDAAVAAVLVAATAEASCDLHLVLVSIEESGSAEYGPDYGRRRRWGRGDEAEGLEAGEVFERKLILTGWRRPDGSEAGFGAFPFTEDELGPPDAFADLTPDEQHFREASGNEGASFERTYRRAGLVLWPRARRLAVLNQAGLAATLPHLEDLTARWEAGGAGIESPLWQEADELSGYMLRSWPRPAWRREGDTNAGRMLDLQIRLGNAARIDSFLAELPAEGHYQASDSAAIVRAAALLARPRATTLLVQIIKSNARADLGACGELLRRCATAPAGPVGDPASIGAALLEILPGDPAKPVETQGWRRPAPVQASFVIDLLTALSRADGGLAARAIEHLLAWPQTFGLDATLVPAALGLAEQAESAAWPAVGRLRAACLDHLRQRIALPLEPPSDWARANALSCTCGDCCGLGAFLLDPDRQQWSLKAAQGLRAHVEQNIRNAACDLDLATDQRGRPYMLVATKNQASYERRAKQRRRDLEHVAALDE